MKVTNANSKMTPKTNGFNMNFSDNGKLIPPPVNAGDAYLVNDLYKRYINPNASSQIYIKASYIGSFLIVGIGIIFGFMSESVNSVTQWIVSGLFGGYTAPNILKWHWWRFNGFGYFAGMVSGVTAALLIPILLPELSPKLPPKLSPELPPALLTLS